MHKITEEQQLTPYAPRPQRQDGEKGLNECPERGSYTYRWRSTIGNVAHVLVAQVLCTWVTVEPAELYLGK